MPEYRSYSHYLWWLIGLLALASIAYALQVTFQSVSSPQTVVAEIPFPTAADYTTQQKGFQYLVSYGDDGFIPATLTVNKGETVRFTNNSSNPLRVVAESGSSFPGVSDCGTSIFDSCRALPGGEYWELTFSQSDEWEYTNFLDASQKGNITVK